MKKIDAFVTAGGIPGPKDPLFAEAGGRPKTMIDVVGKPMVQWVLDALDAAPSIGRIVIAGLAENSGLSTRKPLLFLPDQGGFFENIAASVLRLSDLDAEARYCVGFSGDIPALRPDMVEWLADEVLAACLDVHYLIIRQEVMEARFPGSGRTFVTLRDGRFAGGSVSAFALHKGIPLPRLWDRMARARKNPLRLGGLIGLRIPLLALFHAISSEDIGSLFCRRFGVTGRILESPYAELAMDIDKPRHLERMRRHLGAGDQK